MKKLVSISYLALMIFLASLYLPGVYEKIFFDDIEKTHLFFSPVSKKFILKEKVVGDIPRAVREKSEDHHAAISYQKEDGQYVSRVEFEKLLPFIFYKNMEIWGLLPLEIDGQRFDKTAIKKNRRVLELKPEHITGNSPATPVWPLLESRPGQARLVFPDDRFRMTESAMEFINADFNTVDPDLTRTFTQALIHEGFVFPARSVNGKFTILKPFDEGIFLVDNHFKVFHVKRVNGRPKVIKTPIDPGLGTRYIKISENKARTIYGMLLDQNGNIHLMSYDNYRLTRLPIKGYDPDLMDLKLIFNPLYCTAIYSDESQIHAVAMDRHYTVLASYSHAMSRQTVTPAKRIYSALFPFVLHLGSRGAGFLSLDFRPNGFPGIIGIIGSLILYVVAVRLSGQKKPGGLPLLIVAVTGIYGLIAVRFAGLED